MAEWLRYSCDVVGRVTIRVILLLSPGGRFAGVSRGAWDFGGYFFRSLGKRFQLHRHCRGRHVDVVGGEGAGATRLRMRMVQHFTTVPSTFRPQFAS